jgi:hypothetical protein
MKYIVKPTKLTELALCNCDCFGGNCNCKGGPTYSDHNKSIA